MLNRFEDRLDAMRAQGMTNRQIIAACMEQIRGDAMKKMLDHHE